MKANGNDRPLKLTELLIYIIGAELVGALSALIAGGNFSEYYLALEKPPYSPPAWVFPVAWGILYALMGLAAYLVSLRTHKLRRTALCVYIVQLAVNFLYAPVFFGLKSNVGGLLVSVVLAVLVTVMTVSFARVRRVAAVIVLPYLLWTYYALYLSVGFV
ncbi:TspO/MBR family protein [Ruminococcus sp.]|uniref:TspO/MBR family protein n=1 Tax=Ruminococcus sp. TaxID=41978 RepID=UPI001B285C2E|nr:TspO/MBR family protein [Ruminococcus sp.]MBO5558459.1 tryptophan-rich sensory protein [Ruminococcus sp.]MBP3798815.1 tryptophan-rich sensory protein [Ruminococcus sp.]